jgi:formylglycine-generating enzyme required for sulfatase activity/ankyrin repeat protein
MKINFNFIIFIFLSLFFNFSLHALEKKEIESDISDLDHLFPIEPMIFIKGGCFEMGDHFDEGNYNEIKKNICINDYYIAEHEITQRQWIAVMGNNPSKNKTCGLECPVENISWNEIQQFIKELRNKIKIQYKLPTEAEWEFAARERGRKIRFGNGENILSYDAANFDSSVNFSKEYSLSGDRKLLGIVPIKQYKPNKLGIYDLVGNVSEWTDDWYFDQSFENYLDENSIVPRYGKFKIIKGGSWYEPPIAVRNSFRKFSNPDSKNEELGFRLAISINNKSSAKGVIYSKEDIINMILESSLSKGDISYKSVINLNIDQINAFLYPNLEVTKNDLFNFFQKASLKESSLNQNSNLSNESFISLIKDNDLDLVKKYIDNGVDINAKEIDTSLTPLHVAAMYNNEEIAKIIIKNGADIDPKDKRGIAPLRYVVNNNNIEMVKYLINHGANVNARDFKGHTSLRAASQLGFLSIVELLLKNNADVNIQTSDNRIPIFEAVENKHFEVVKLLILNGSYVNVKDKKGDTPLSLAIKNNQSEMINFLKSKGALE